MREEEGRLTHRTDSCAQNATSGAVALTNARIVDRQNAFQLVQRFDFPNDKSRVQQLLARAQ